MNETKSQEAVDQRGVDYVAKLVGDKPGITPFDLKVKTRTIDGEGTDIGLRRAESFVDAAVEQGLITEEEIDKQLRNLVRTRFKLGLFDPAELNPYNKIPVEKLGAKEHVDLAREVAAKSIVLLKNKNNQIKHRHKIRKKMVWRSLKSNGSSRRATELWLGTHGNLASKDVALGKVR